MVDVRDLMRLDGRVAIVTGGARGIGRETAATLAVAGARIVLGDLDKETAERAAAEMRALGLHVTAIVAHVADEASVDLMVQATLKREGRLDILVNNAGIAIRRPVASAPTNIQQADAGVTKRRRAATRVLCACCCS